VLALARGSSAAMTWPLTALIAMAAVITAVWITLNRWKCWQDQLLAEATASMAPAVHRDDDHDVASPDAMTGGAAVSATSVGPRLTLRRIEPSPATGAPAPGTLAAGDWSSPRSRRQRWGFAAAAAVLAVGAVLVIGERLAVLAFVYLGAVLVPLLVCDVRLHRLPTCFIAPAYPVVAAALTADAAVTGEWARLGVAALGCLILGGAYLVLCVMPGGLMGLGDVRLAGVLGAGLAWVGWDTLLVGALGAFVLSFFVALPRLLLRRMQLRSRVPFGPFMLAAAALSVAAGA